MLMIDDTKNKTGENKVLNKKDRAWLQAAANSPTLSQLTQLLQQGANPLVQNELGNNFLHIVVKKNINPGQTIQQLKLALQQTQPKKKTAILQQLFEQCNNHGNTPLHTMAYSNNFPVSALTKIDVLITDWNVQNHKGDTPLHLAAAYHHSSFARALKTNGASLNITNKKGEKPYQSAKHTTLVNELNPALVLSQSSEHLANDNNDPEEKEQPAPPPTLAHNVHIFHRKVLTLDEAVHEAAKNRTLAPLEAWAHQADFQRQLISQLQNSFWLALYLIPENGQSADSNWHYKAGKLVGTVRFSDQSVITLKCNLATASCINTISWRYQDHTYKHNSIMVYKDAYSWQYNDKDHISHTESLRTYNGDYRNVAYAYIGGPKKGVCQRLEALADLWKTLAKAISQKQKKNQNPSQTKSCLIQ